MFCFWLPFQASQKGCQGNSRDAKVDPIFSSRGLLGSGIQNGCTAKQCVAGTRELHVADLKEAVCRYCCFPLMIKPMPEMQLIIVSGVSREGHVCVESLF